MTWEVKLFNELKEGLAGISQYISNTLHAPETAQKLINRIMSGIYSLDEMPMRNPIFDKEPWKSRGFRKLIIDNYIVFYYVKQELHQVMVASIMYGGRNIEDILSI